MNRKSGLLAALALGGLALFMSGGPSGSGSSGSGKGRRRMKTRDAALALLDAYTPAAQMPLSTDPPLARAHFNEIAGDFFKAEHLLHGTTCGYVPPWLLWRLGITDASIIDRTSIEDGLVYTPGAQIARLISGAKKFGAWHAFKPGVSEPEPGDPVYFFREGPSGSFQGGEHVAIFRGTDGASWTTTDGGRGAVTAQRIERVKRPLVGNGEELQFSGGPRAIIGFVSLAGLLPDVGDYDVSDLTAGT